MGLDFIFWFRFQSNSVNMKFYDCHIWCLTFSFRTQRSGDMIWSYFFMHAKQMYLLTYWCEKENSHTKLFFTFFPSVCHKWVMNEKWGGRHMYNFILLWCRAKRNIFSLPSLLTFAPRLNEYRKHEAYKFSRVKLFPLVQAVPYLYCVDIHCDCEFLLI